MCTAQLAVCLASREKCWPFLHLTPLCCLLASLEWLRHKRPTCIVQYVLINTHFIEELFKCDCTLICIQCSETLWWCGVPQSSVRQYTKFSKYDLGQRNTAFLWGWNTRGNEHSGFGGKNSPSVDPCSLFQLELQKYAHIMACSDYLHTSGSQLVTTDARVWYTYSVYWVVSTDTALSSFNVWAIWKRQLFWLRFISEFVDHPRKGGGWNIFIYH